MRALNFARALCWGIGFLVLGTSALADPAPHPTQRLGCDGSSTTPTLRMSDERWAQQVVEWLSAGSDARTGLIEGFRGPGAELKFQGQGALYDQAIAAILLIDTGRLDRAERMLDTLDRLWVGRGLPNWLTLTTASAGVETLVHTGPTAWVGLAAYRYYARTGNLRYLDFARSIARWATTARVACGTSSRIPDAHPPWLRVGGAEAPCAPSMGPVVRTKEKMAGLPWHDIVATEHVLDAFALVAMLRRDQRIPTDERADLEASERELGRYLSWSVHQDQECLQVNGSKQAPCILAGGEFGGKRSGWNRGFNPSDVYFWWVAVSHAWDLEGIQRAWPHGPVRTDAELLDHAWGRFLTSAQRGGTDARVTGMDYTRVPDTSTTCQVMGDDGVIRCVARQTPLVSVEWTGEAVLADRLIQTKLPGRTARWPVVMQSMDGLGACSLQNVNARSAGMPQLGFPYATAGGSCVFPGGWLTPGVAASALPSSIAGTVWLAFGQLGLNPFASAPPPQSTAAFYPKPSRDTAALRSRAPCPNLAPDSFKYQPSETLVAASWMCLTTGSDGSAPDLDRALAYLDYLIDESFRYDHRDTCADRAEPTPLRTLAREENAAGKSRCTFDLAALNDIGTAHFLRARVLEAKKQDPNTKGDLRALGAVSNACYYQPPTELYDGTDVPAEIPAGRLFTLEEALRLRGFGRSERVAKSVCERYSDAGRYCDPWKRRSRWIPSLFSEGEAHLNYARNLFFIEGQNDIVYAVLSPRVGLRFNVADGLNADAYGDFSVVGAFGDDPVDHVPWLNFWRPGLGGRLAFNRAFLSGPPWLVAMNAEVGASYHVVRYFPGRTTVAPDLTDTDFSGGAGAWTLEAWPLSSSNVLPSAWSEVAASAIYSNATIEGAQQEDLRVRATTLAGLDVLRAVEPYALMTVGWNPLAPTDWDNNLRAGIGTRIPLFEPRSESSDSFASLLVRLDVSWQHTLVYWPNAVYVPSFRPRDDVHVSLDLWGGAGATRAPVTTAPGAGIR